jgi:L-lactate dehydrogenase complex protein LldF
VKIDIHHQLYKWQQIIMKEQNSSFTKKMIMKAMGFVFSRPYLYRFAGKMGRKLVASMPRFVLYNRLNTWGNGRELPQAPEQSFREWYLNNKLRTKD